MFLSLLHVNTANRPGRQWLGSLYRIHQRLWMAFPGEEDRLSDEFFLRPWRGPATASPKPQRGESGFLFRIERDGPARILVQSARQPRWDYAFQNAPHLLVHGPQLRSLDPAPRAGEAYHFRLLAHVVRSVGVAREDRRPRQTRSGLTIARRKRSEVPIYPNPTPEPLPLDPAERQRTLAARWTPWREWLTDLSQRHGFEVIDGPQSPLWIQAQYTAVRKPEWDRPRRFNGGLFDGRLRCTDPDALRGAIVNGVGHAKAFGFGLLSIAPA